MGLQLVVRTPGSPDRSLTAGVGYEFQGLEQLEELDPPITWNPIIRNAFLCLTDRVEILGEKMAGAFTKTDDFVRLQVRAGRLTAIRFTVYEFSGWSPR